MSRVLVTGSAQGLGRLTAESLLSDGHHVTAHARNRQRADDLTGLREQGADLVIADLADVRQVRELADRLAGQHFDAIIHNAGVWEGPAVMPVNVVAPYLLTALLPLPQRLVFLSSSMHRGGRDDVRGVDWSGTRPGSYEDSKLFVTTLAMAVARRFPDVHSNAVDPGWVPTRMGGAGAPDDLELGHRTQEWLGTSADAEAATSGGYWYHRERQMPHRASHDEGFQEQLLEALPGWTGDPLQG